MRKFRDYIWKDGEYNYEASYGFIPSIHGFIHDEDNDKRDVMLVVPGGGYCMCTPHESELVGDVFYKQGMNVFVLTYTTDITMSVPLKMQPLEDVSRAVRYIRKNGAEYNIEGKKLILCGFSAGAHVAGSLAVHYKDVTDKSKEYADISNRPDGAILAYPVITTGEFTHEYSVQALLGKSPTEAELEYFSLEKQVTSDTPPCFIWQTLTDNLVPVENSYLMANALRKQGIMYAHYVFPTGFHGLSYPSEKFFTPQVGGEYGFEQLEKAVAAVKAGKGVRVSEQRKKELEEQFPDKADNASEEKATEEPRSLSAEEKAWCEEIGLWPELARVWMSRI